MQALHGREIGIVGVRQHMSHYCLVNGMQRTSVQDILRSVGKREDDVELSLVAFSWVERSRSLHAEH